MILVMFKWAHATIREEFSLGGPSSATYAALQATESIDLYVFSLQRCSTKVML